MKDGKLSSGYERPIVQFYKLISDGRDPKRADRSGAGFLPGRAMRYCDALTTATGYGYWVFPPIDFQLMWDGDQVFWSFGEGESWLPLSGTSSGAAQFPDFASHFDEVSPRKFKGYSPPFLTALPEHGGIQIWTGLLARTRPGWSLNVRQPVNLPGVTGLIGWEGIVESDHWFGPLFNNFRITRTDFPVRLRANTPFLQVQPVAQIAYHESTLSNSEVLKAEDMTNEDWGEFGQVILPNQAKTESQGTYAVRLRKRRACPHHRIMMNELITKRENI